jgi:hypothetical protein
MGVVVYPERLDLVVRSSARAVFLDRRHRRLLAEYLAEHLRGIVVTHLVAERATKPKQPKRKTKSVKLEP